MAELDITRLTGDLVAFDSVSRNSNEPIAGYLGDLLTGLGYEVERQRYVDANGITKVNLIARKGPGDGGLAFFSHMDTVPGNGWEDRAWTLQVEPDRLIGLGACDMKGPLAATIIAAERVPASDLRRPVWIVLTADEEISGVGARHVVDGSQLVAAGPPAWGVVAEPTELIPIGAHKGVGFIRVTAHGESAHSSTERGTSANFLIAPFLAEMAELAKELKRDPGYQNPDFDPPTLGFNMVLNDGATQPNVTAAKTVCTLSLRPMPNDRSADVVERITSRAREYGFEVESRLLPGVWCDPGSPVVQAALAATGATTTESVPYGTDGIHLQEITELIVLGPGDIRQAHTHGEWILRSQLDAAVGIYVRMIEQLCR